MKRRSPAAPLLLPFVTFGIYSLVWYVKTKNELNQTITSRIPTAWLLIVPIANIFWQVAFARGVREYNGRGSTAGNFWILAILSLIGAAIIQSGLNQTTDAKSAAPAFVPAPAAATAPSDALV